MTDRSPGLEPDAASPMRARLRGDLTIDTAGSLLEAGRRWLAEQPAGSVAELDLSGVHRCDSAALVLLVDWLRTARSRGGELSLRALPEALRAMLPLLGLAGLLGEAGETEAATSCTMTGSTAH